MNWLIDKCNQFIYEKYVFIWKKKMEKITIS